MQISSIQVKELRDKTGVSVMQCKKALEEAGGDMEKALLILKKKSTEIAAKKSDRELSAGFVAGAQKDGTAVALVLRCETDFVAKNDEFKNLAIALAQTLLEKGEEAMRAEASDKISQAIQKLGENIEVGNFSSVSAPVLASYVHDGRVAAIVGLSKGTEVIAKDIAMHITAMNPEYKTRTDVPESMIESVRALFEEEVKTSGKPADIQEKMLSGKIDTFFKERTLMDQSFIKNPDTSIAGLLKTNDAELVEFVRISA